MPHGPCVLCKCKKTKPSHIIKYKINAATIVVGNSMCVARPGPWWDVGLRSRDGPESPLPSLLSPACSVLGLCSCHDRLFHNRTPSGGKIKTNTPAYTKVKKVIIKKTIPWIAALFAQNPGGPGPLCAEQDRVTVRRVPHRLLRSPCHRAETPGRDIGLGHRAGPAGGSQRRAPCVPLCLEKWTERTLCKS